jgi:hypothetical protein
VQVPVQNICSVRPPSYLAAHVPQAYRPRPADSHQRRRSRDRLRHAGRVWPRAVLRGRVLSRASRPAIQISSPAWLGGAGQGPPRRLWDGSRERRSAANRLALPRPRLLAGGFPRRARALRRVDGPEPPALDRQTRTAPRRHVNPGSRVSVRAAPLSLPPHTKAAPEGGFEVKDRRRPTLPGGCPPSTIGAEGLNGSVRNGKRCFPLAMTTEIVRDRSAPARLENCTQAKREK